MSENSPTILLIEDEALMADLLVEEMEKRGFRVLWAADARMAAAFCEKEKIDAVFTDLFLHGSNGLDFIQSLQSKDIFIPFAVFSGMEDETFKQRAQDMGAVAYLEKPFSMIRFYNVLELLVRSHRKIS